MLNSLKKILFMLWIIFRLPGSSFFEFFKTFLLFVNVLEWLFRSRKSIKKGNLKQKSVLLNFNYVFQVKAALRTFKPRETKFMNPEQKFKRQLLIRRFNQLKELYYQVAGKFSG